MTEQEKAMHLALEALIEASGHVNNEVFVKVMMARDAINDALRAALSDAALERMAENERELGIQMQPAQDEPKREWVGLTESEIIRCSSVSIFRFYDAIEAKLKSKNA